MPLKEDQKYELIKVFSVEPRSVQDIADIIGVHYVTAHRWTKELLDLELIRKLPFQRGKEYVYVPASQQTEAGIPLVQVGKDLKTVAQLTQPLQNTIEGYWSLEPVLRTSIDVR